MALEDLTPVTRTEAILDGDEISPVTRMEYFLGKAANEVPKPVGVSDAGKVLTVNAAGDGFELDTPASGLPAYTGADLGKVLTLGEGSGIETVVVPEQTVTVDGGSASVPNFDFSNVSAGDSFTLTVNGVPYTGVAVASEVGIACVEETSAYGYTVAYTGVLAIFTGTDLQDGSYTISLTVSIPSVEPKWETAGGGSADSVQLQVGQPTAVGNTANMAIYADNVELSSYAAVSAYLTAIKNKRLYVVVASGSAYFVYNSITISDDGANNAYVLFAMSDGTNLHPVTAGWTESK